MTHQFLVEMAGAEREVTVETLEDNRYRVRVGEKIFMLDARRVVAGERSSTWSLLDENGKARTIDIDGTLPDLNVTGEGVTVPLKIQNPRDRVSAQTSGGKRGGSGAVVSPMPGKVVKILVKVGDEVKAGQSVAVVEAMKMENELRIGRDGKISKIGAQEGQAVEAGQILVDLE